MLQLLAWVAKTGHGKCPSYSTSERGEDWGVAYLSEERRAILIAKATLNGLGGQLEITALGIAASALTRAKDALTYEKERPCREPQAGASDWRQAARSNWRWQSSSRAQHRGADAVQGLMLRSNSASEKDSNYFYKVGLLIGSIREIRITSKGCLA